LFRGAGEKTRGRPSAVAHEADGEFLIGEEAAVGVAGAEVHAPDVAGREPVAVGRPEGIGRRVGEGDGVDPGALAVGAEEAFEFRARGQPPAGAELRLGLRDGLGGRVDAELDRGAVATARLGVPALADRAAQPFDPAREVGDIEILGIELPEGRARPEQAEGQRQGRDEGARVQHPITIAADLLIVWQNNRPVESNS